MQVRPGRGPHQTPERLDWRFGLVAGIYVAALLSPALVLVVGQRLELTSRFAVLGTLGAVGTVLTAAVARAVSRWGELVGWFDSAWVAVLLPVVGAVPMALYLFDAFLFLALTVTDLQADSVATLVGFVGFLLGIAAASLGSFLVLMGRTRLAHATVDDTEVTAEWTAGWPRRARLRLMTGALAVAGLLAGLAIWQLGWWVAPTVFTSGMVLVIVLRSVVEERTYRATSPGLEQCRAGRWFSPRRLVPWSRFDGFSVTDDAVVLHRDVPHVDVRCRRYLVDDEAVVAALEAHLDRRDS